MLLACTARSIAPLLKPRGNSAPKLKLADLPRYVRDELGLSGLALSTDLLTGSTPDRLTAFRERADKSACACLLLMEPNALPFGDPDLDKGDAAIDRARRVVEAAALLGCNSASIRLDAKFHNKPAEDDETIDRVAERIRDVMRVAERREINLLISPHQGLTHTPERLTDLIKKIGGFRVGTLPDFKDAVDSGDPATYLRRLTPYASAVLASTFEFGEAAPAEPDDDKPGSLEDLADMLMSSEAAPHLTYDLQPLVDAINTVGFDGTLAIDFRGPTDGTLGVMQSREALEAALESLAE